MVGRIKTMKKNRWMVGWMDRKKLEGWLDGYKSGWMAGYKKQMNDGMYRKKIEGWLDGYKNGWLDGYK